MNSMVKLNFNGQVSAQAAPGETVTVTAPDGSVAVETALTLDDLTYVTTAQDFTIVGDYTYVASVDADAKYKSATANGVVTITSAEELADRTITVNANVA